ncbi:phage protein GemA/Gp16 family protein [Ralstonia solanacearum]|uniref:phage protein GemA/Gp16 family protein n=1 Tax=Ralstonia solanacearum TaxID=305 RepID=UPI001E5ED19E|nr:phage protein GemA/Gp16 family protein [Ralstonia solanacearum]
MSTSLIKHYRQLVGIAKGWATANLPGWSDDTHRDLLARHGAAVVDGRVSASTLNLAQLGAVLDDYERRGWSRHRRVFHKAEGKAAEVPPRIAHLVRLWGKLGQAGKVAKATRPALLAFCARQVGRQVPDLDSLAVKECQTVAEALKGWLARG